MWRGGSSVRTGGVILGLLAALGFPVFFGVSALLGYTYLGSDSSAAFRIYSVLIAALVLGISLISVLRDGARYPAVAWMIAPVPALLVASYLVELPYKDPSAAVELTFRSFVIWAIPAFYAGYYVAAKGRWFLMQKYWDVVMVLFSVVGIRVAIDYVTGGWFRAGMGGATYQTLSYTTALAFGLNLHLLEDGAALQRFAFAEHRAYRIVSYCLLPVQLLCIVISGGRGGMVLAVVYGITILVRRRSLGGRLKSSLVVASIAVLSILLIQLSLSDTTVRGGLNRVFAYVGSEGIDWAGTSGRDALYARAATLGAERPWLGYGPFGYQDALVPFRYPHNLFLEIQLAHGGVGLVLGAVLLVWAVIRHRALTEYDRSYIFLGVIAMYQFVLLMFSGSYLASATIWFVVGLVIASTIPKRPDRTVQQASRGLVGSA